MSEQPVPNTTEKDETLVEVSPEERALNVVRAVKDMLDFQRIDLEKEWEALYREEYGIYEKSDTEDNEKGRQELTSKLFIKIAKSLKRAAKAAILRQVFAGGPDRYFGIEESKQFGGDIDPQKAKLLEVIIKNLHRKQRRRRELGLFVDAMLTYGTGFALVVPEEHTTKSFTVIKGKIKSQKKKSKRPVFKNLDIRNVFIDINAEDPQDGVGFIIRSFISKNEYDELVDLGAYTDIPGIKEKLSSGRDDPKQDRNQANDYSSDGQQGIEIWDYWGLFEGEEWFITVANGLHILNMETNPFWNKRRPMMAANYEPRPHEIYGDGVIGLARGSARLINHLWRMKADNLALINNAEQNIDITKIYNVGEEDFKRFPGKQWLSRGGQAVTNIPIIPITNDAYELQSLERFTQEESGVPKILGGQSSTVERTATEVDAQLANVSMGIAEIGEAFEMDVIVPMLTMDYEQIIQFMDEAEMTALAGDKAIEIGRALKREDVIGNYDFKPRGTSFTLAKIQVNNQIINFRQAFGDLPANWEELGRRFLENQGMRGVDEIMPEGGVVSVQALAQALQLAGQDPQEFAQVVQLAQNPEELQAQVAQAQQQGQQRARNP